MLYLLLTTCPQETGLVGEYGDLETMYFIYYYNELFKKFSNFFVVALLKLSTIAGRGPTQILWTFLLAEIREPSTQCTETTESSLSTGFFATEFTALMVSGLKEARCFLSL